MKGQRDLAGLSALVTGATSGIGRAVSNELGRQGAEVIVHARDATRGGERRRLQLQFADLVVGERFVEPALDALVGLAPHDPRRAPDLQERA